MAWHNESRRHALASKGIKTAVDNKALAVDRIVGYKTMKQAEKGAEDLIVPYKIGYDEKDKYYIETKNDNLNLLLGTKKRPNLSLATARIVRQRQEKYDYENLSPQQKKRIKKPDYDNDKTTRMWRKQLEEWEEKNNVIWEYYKGDYRLVKFGK